jgi:hypothetical protein
MSSDTFNSYVPTALEAALSGIIGLHMKCAKSVWTLDGERLKIGADGFSFTALPSTAVWGQQRWLDGHPVDPILHKYSDGFPDYEKLPGGWDAYTGINGLTLGGEVLTFTSAYGARATIKNLFTQYQFRRMRQFPICTLATKPRGDAFENIDPVFRIAGWKNAHDFADVLPPELIEAAPAAAQQLSGPSIIVTSAIQRDPRRDAPRDEAPPVEDDTGEGPSPFDDVAVDL